MYPNPVENRLGPGLVPLACGGQTCPLVVDPGDHPAVLRAARDLADDFGRVTGTAAALVPGLSPGPLIPVVAGTLGRSPLIDALAADHRLPEGLPGRWEAFCFRVVNNPFPGCPRALVIAGSDRRGTIYGLYELAAHIGVSPWHWWADVPVRRSEVLGFREDFNGIQAPGVAYRGIFLNDEYPALTRWVAARWGEASPGVANYGREFHALVFELLLRLKANLFWPAMWNNAFHEDDPANTALAEEYGIVLGTSHQEPMGRAQKEWDRRYKDTLGHWNYGAHPEVLESFWREGMERNKRVEQLYTVGLRGADDTEMAPGGPEANRALLEHIVGRQRAILAQTLGRPAEEIPQVWCLYKEVTDYYDAGMRVPDDVLLLWGEDNWGNLRRVPTEAERQRSGGAGIYYHFDYHGGPRSYQWANTSPVAKIWDQMTLARRHGADRLWVVNVGHLKGYEQPLSFFLDLAWNPEGWTSGSVGDFPRLWAESLFGSRWASEAGSLLAELARLYGRRKPELWRPDTDSLVHDREAERVEGEWSALATRAEALAAELPPEGEETFYQLVLHPARSGLCLSALYHAAGRNALGAVQGRTGANGAAAEVRRLFERFRALSDEWGRRSGGKWNHFQDQPVLGYVAWNDPPEDNLDHLDLKAVTPKSGAQVGFAVEGLETAVSSGGLSLPVLDSRWRSTAWFEVFSRGTEAFDFAVQTQDGWLTADRRTGTVDDAARITVGVDWDQVPDGVCEGRLRVAAAGSHVEVRVPLDRREVPPGLPPGTWVETAGLLSIRSVHAASGGWPSWEPVAGYGPDGQGMRSLGPSPGWLGYPVWVHTAGTALVRVHFSPVLNYRAGQPVGVAVRFTGESTQDLALVPTGYRAGHDNPDWCRAVAEEGRVAEVRLVLPAGRGLLEVSADEGPVLTRIEVDFGGLVLTRLGPPESPRTGFLPDNRTAGRKEIPQCDDHPRGEA